MEVRYHPLFERWLAELAEADEEIVGEAEDRLDRYARQHSDTTPIVKRGNR